MGYERWRAVPSDGRSHREGQVRDGEPAVDRATGRSWPPSVGRRELVGGAPGEREWRRWRGWSAGAPRHRAPPGQVLGERGAVCLLMDLCEELYDELHKSGGWGPRRPSRGLRRGGRSSRLCRGWPSACNGVVHRDLKPENILLTSQQARAAYALPRAALLALPQQGPRGTQGTPGLPNVSARPCGVRGRRPGIPWRASPPAPRTALPLPMAARHLAPIPVPGSASSRLEHAATRAPTGGTPRP